MTHEHHIVVRRTARFYTTGGGEPSAVRQLLLVCHGYAQLAARFLSRFEPLADDSRLIVAPEGLSRFYLEHATRVGASWMTRDDRMAEIDDYLGFLDAVYEQACAPSVARGAALHVLGFSQGVATAARWVARHPGRARRLVVWAALLPPELELSGPWIDGLEIVLVIGARDELIDSTRWNEQEERLRNAGVALRSLRFDGGHVIDAGILRILATS
ncbi:MAG TPA: hypothetical protein VFK13_02585 [Gemmatimonadaceae bacterium]|nr:hypothetical protein [Gemmatimonadaceae bacterium]